MELIKTIQTKSGKLLLIKVPKLSFYFDWKTNSDFDEFITIYCETEDGWVHNFKTEFTSPNQFEIIGKFSELEDKDFEEFVEFDDVSGDFIPHKFKIAFKNYNLQYEFEDDERYYCFVKAKESFQSLCKSQGIEDDLDNYLIIKNI
jgi:hypothetical protein